MLESLLKSHLLSPFLASAVLCVALALLLMRPQASTAFTDKSGRKMKMVRGDTRVRRFSYGREISDEGHAIAQGDPYLIRNGSRYEVVLCKPQHLEEFFAGDAREHWKAPDGNMGYFFHRLLGQCVGAQSGEEWRKIRSLFDPIYRPTAMAGFTQKFRAEVRAWLASLASRAGTKTHSPTSFTADVTRLCTDLPLKLVAWTLYGETLDDKAFAELLQLTEDREELGSDSFLRIHMISKIYAWLPTRSNRQLERYAKRFRDFNLRMVAAADAANIECPLGPIVRDMEATGRLSMEQLLHTVDEILFENLDVASSALSCLLLNMAGDAAVQEELRTEIGRFTPSLEAYLARSDTFLEHCCAESRRLCPAIWFTFCERSPRDKVIGGYRVPANTDVSIDWKRISIDSPVWSRGALDGYDFRPSRYAGLSPADCRYSRVGYGAGARKCLGQHFGSLLMRLVLAEVVSRYRISAEFRPWELGFRRDKFILTPNSQGLLFEAI